jgi:hypothetical protein
MGIAEGNPPGPVRSTAMAAAGEGERRQLHRPRSRRAATQSASRHAHPTLHRDSPEAVFRPQMSRLRRPRVGKCHHLLMPSTSARRITG